MGNCCCPSGSDGDQQRVGTRTQTFQGEGHRLGSVDEAKHRSSPPTAPSMTREDEVPAPVINPNLTNEEREKIRADRAAAAEARLKKQNPGKKKTTTNSAAPLNGPNTQPLMRWN